MSLFVFFFISILLCFFNGATTTEFDFSTLPISNLKLLGDARLSNGIVSLTRDLSVPNSGAGKVLYSNPIRFRQPGTHFPTSFSTFFSNRRWSRLVSPFLTVPVQNSSPSSSRVRKIFSGDFLHLAVESLRIDLISRVQTSLSNEELPMSYENRML